jgi:hypothetical protein
MENVKTEIKSSMKIEVTEKTFNNEGVLTGVREGKAKLERTEEENRVPEIDEDSLSVHLGCGCHKIAVDGSSSATPVK